ncbi:unnamed protein product [Arctogadus glacialis]
MTSSPTQQSCTLLDFCSRMITNLETWWMFYSISRKSKDGLEIILVGGDRLTEGNSKNHQWTLLKGKVWRTDLKGLFSSLRIGMLSETCFEINANIWF